MELLWEGPGFEISLDPSIPALINRHVGFYTTEEFKTGVEKIVELYGQKAPAYGYLHYISDNRNMPATAPESIEWVSNYFPTEMSKKGLKGVIVLVPHDIFASMNIEDFSAQANELHGFFTLYASTMEEAIQLTKKVSVEA
jgi:hypothetical protein